MFRRTVTAIIIAMLLTSTLTLAFNIQPVKPELSPLTVPEESAIMQGTINLASQDPPPAEWNRTYGGTSDDGASALVQTGDGGYALAGGGFANLVKTDAGGNVQWTKSYGSGVSSCDLVHTVDDGYALAGTNIVSGSYDFWLVKTDESGIMQWNRTYGGTSGDEVYALVQTTDGGYALAGLTRSFGAGGNDFWLVKTDELGNMQWNQTYGGTGDDKASALVQTSDGGYALAGWTDSFGAGYEDFWLVKTDANGTMMWNQTYDEEGHKTHDFAHALVQTSDGGYALAGTYNGVAFWLVKTDANGNVQWTRYIRRDIFSRAYALVCTVDGGYALAGYTWGTVDYSYNFWLVKTDELGNMQWNQTYGGTGDDKASALVQTRDGGYAIAGYTNSFGAGGWDVWLIKIGWTDFAVRIVGHTLSLDSDDTVNAVLNVTMLSPRVSSKDVTCCLVLVDTTGKEVYNNFAGIGGPHDNKNTLIENNTITSVEFTFQLQEPRPGKYAYTISIWSSDKGQMFDSTDWILAFDVPSTTIYTLNLGTLYADSYLQDNPLILLASRYELVNYTFRLADSVTDLSVKVFTLPNSEFKCSLNASNAQMDLHGEILPHFNVWHNVPANTYEMSLEMESVGANLVRVVIQAGPSIESPSVKIIGVEPTSIFATPGGTMTYKIDVGFNVTTYDDLVLTATLDGQVFNHTYSVEPFKSNTVTAYMQIYAPSEIGQYTVDFNASLLNVGIFDTATAPLNVDSAIYNIAISPTVKYYQESLKSDSWRARARYVSDPSKLNALDVTNIRISSVDERDSQTGKPSMVSISFDAANKEKDIHHIVQVKIGSDTYTLGTVIYGDEPRRMEAHNIPVVNDKVSFTIIYQKWTFGNWFAEVGTKSAKAILGLVLPTVAPGFSAIWFATGDIATQLAKYTILYAEQIWTERENGYMTIDDATRIIESSGIQQSDFLQFLTTAVKFTHNPFHAFLDTVGFLCESGKMNPWNHARAYIAGFKHILDNAETRLLNIMVNAFGSAALKLGITLVAMEIVKQAFNEVLNAELFLKALGSLINIAQAIENAWNILWSPSEEGKEVSNAQIGTDPAKEVDPVVSMSFEGQADYTNETCFGDTLSMNVSFNQTQAQVFLEVDNNLTAVYLAMLSDSVCRSGILSSFGFNATQTSLEWRSEDSVFIVEAMGSPYDGLIGFQFWMNSTYVEGTQVMSADAIGTGNTAWLNGTLRYPFGKDLAYEINVTMPRGSEIIQILSDGNFTVEDNTALWSTPIDGLAIEFVPPNVATTEVVPAKTVVGQNCSTRVNATVANHSNSTQTVNITIYANTIIIGTQTVFLESKTFMTILLDWNTTGFAYGNYTLSAYAWPVPDETNTADNNLTGGWVIVSMVGDITGPEGWPDGKCDMRDIGLVARNFGQTVPPAPANCDLTGPTVGVPDGKIDMRDISLVARHFGDHYP